jgi:hypothetical protein
MYAAVAGGFRNSLVGCVSLYLVVCVLVYGHKDIYILLKVALNTINNNPHVTLIYTTYYQDTDAKYIQELEAQCIVKEHGCKS